MEQEQKPGLLDVTTRRGYDIACAMRGPDHDSTAAVHAKWVTAAVVRHALGCKHGLEGAGYCFTPERAKEIWKEFTPERQVAVRQYLVWEGAHFYHHFHCAISHLAKGNARVKEYMGWFALNVL